MTIRPALPRESAKPSWRKGKRRGILDHPDKADYEHTDFTFSGRETHTRSSGPPLELRSRYERPSTRGDRPSGGNSGACQQARCAGQGEPFSPEWRMPETLGAG